MWISRNQNSKHERREKMRREKKHLVLILFMADVIIVYQVLLYSTTRDAIHSTYFASLFYGFCVVTHLYARELAQFMWNEYFAEWKNKFFSQKNYVRPLLYQTGTTSWKICIPSRLRWHSYTTNDDVSISDMDTFFPWFPLISIDESKKILVMEYRYGWLYRLNSIANTHTHTNNDTQFR